MGVKEYFVKGKRYYEVNEWLRDPNGRRHRVKQKRVPTKEKALALQAKWRVDAFEGRFFNRVKPNTYTVAQAWESYEPITRRDNRSWESDIGRARHLVRILGKRLVVELNQRHIDDYRNVRLAEVTVRGTPPSPATLDHEVGLLKRMLNYAQKCGDIQFNPVLGISLMRVPNVRRVVLTEEEFTRLHDAAEPALKPILLVGYDNGLRKREILHLRWPQVDLKAGTIRLAPQDTKGGEHRPTYMTTRVREALSQIQRREDTEFVFVSPRTGRPYVDVRHMFRRALRKAGLPDGVWFHDSRRSFITNARRRGVPESVVMKLSGHRTRAVFERYNIINEDDIKNAIATLEAGAKAELGTK